MQVQPETLDNVLAHVDLDFKNLFGKRKPIHSSHPGSSDGVSIRGDGGGGGGTATGWLADNPVTPLRAPISQPSSPFQRNAAMSRPISCNNKTGITTAAGGTAGGTAVVGIATSSGQQRLVDSSKDNNNNNRNREYTGDNRDMTIGVGGDDFNSEDDALCRSHTEKEMSTASRTQLMRIMAARHTGPK